MSRSYRHHQIRKYGTQKFGKTQANKKVRRTPDIANGKQYRKHYKRWNIVEQYSRCTWKEWCQIHNDFLARGCLRYAELYTWENWLTTYWWK